MGIRFFCPNGHKLNVKAFLAGKRGICPHCNAKVLIPAQSTLEVPRKDGHGENPTAESPPPIDRSVPAGEPVVSIELPDDVTGGASDDSTGGATENAAGVTASEPGKPPRLPQALPLAKDPLKEAPDAAWYVRISGGGEYGPATPKIMRQWIEEGRVVADCMVWREGWNDWREALDTFPSLRDGVIPEIDTGDTLPGRAESGGPTRPSGYIRPSRSHSTRNRAVVITTLLMLVIVGAVVLGWVVSR